MQITRTSLLSGVTRTRDLDISPEQWAAYEAGDYIQRALGHLSDGDREFILTGSTEEEWDTEFKEIGECSQCGEPITQADLNVEAFEATGELTCASCANEADDESDGQPDEAQEWADFDPEC